MKIPPVITILGHKYTLEVVPAHELTTGIWGDYQTRYQKIRLQEGLTESMTANVFLHELCELILNFTLECELEHSKITSAADILFAVMRDNCLNFGGE